MKKSSTDLTQGSITGQLVMFMLPILLGQIFQSVYNSVDAIVVGNALGKTALAAVTSCADIGFLLVGFFSGLSTGAGVLFARYFGAKKQQLLHDSIHTAVLFSVIVGVSMAVAGVLGTPLLLKMTDCPPDVYGEAEAYLRIYLVGILFTAIYNVGAAVLRAVGDSKNPFLYLVISSVSNIFLDLLFVMVIPMGVAGAAFATILAQGLSVALVFRRLIKADDVYKLSLRDLKINKKILKEVIDLGLPSAIQSSLISLSNLFVLRYINGFGSSATAGIGAAKKIDKFAGIPAQSLGLSLAPFVSQNFGAGKTDRAVKGIRASVALAFGFIAAAGSVIYICAAFFVKLFIDEPDAVSYGVSMIRTMMPFYFFQALNQIFANATRGFGKSRVVMICSVSGMIVCRQIFLAITMSLDHNVKYVYYGYPVGWACAAIAVMVYYWLAIRRKMLGMHSERHSFWHRHYH